MCTRVINVLLAAALLFSAGCSSRPPVWLDAAAAERGPALDARIDRAPADGAGLDLPRSKVPWATSAGGKQGWVEGHDVAVDRAGNAYVAGVFAGTVSFGATTLTAKGVEDLFVAKVSPAGAFLWAVRAGGSNAWMHEVGLAVDGGSNTYVTGVVEVQSTSSTPVAFGTKVLTAQAKLLHRFVSKLSPAGAFLWAVQGELDSGSGPSESTGGNSIAVDSTGRVYIAGGYYYKATYGSTVLLGKGKNIFVVSLSPSGAFLWAKTTTGANDTAGANEEWASAIAADGAGTVVITGLFGDQGWTTFGSTVLQPADTANVFLARVSAAGSFSSATSPGSYPYSYLPHFPGLALDGAGNACLVGLFSKTATFGAASLSGGGVEAYLVKIDPQGATLWALATTSALFNTVVLTDVAVDSTGACLATGVLWGTSAIGQQTLTSKGQSEVVVVKVSPSGKLVTAGSSASMLTAAASGNAIALDGSDHTWVVGSFEGSVTFGATTLTSTSTLKPYRDLFIWRSPAQGL